MKHWPKWNTSKAALMVCSNSYVVLNLTNIAIWLNDCAFLYSTETLRKHPPFDLLYRLCTKDYKIADSDVVIEKGTPLFFSITATQTDPEFGYSDEFEPERFMDDRNFNKNSIETPYLTFGDGPRNCIGLRFGKLQAKIGICVLLSKFSFELGAKLANKKLQFEPLAESRIVVGGVHLKIRVR